MCKERRLVSLFDVHVPDNIDLKPVLNFIKDFKPHIITIPGDFLDLDMLSKWSQRRLEYFLEDEPREKYDYMIDKGNEILDKIDKTMAKDNAEKDYIIGNHEDRLTKLLQQFADKKRTILDAYDYVRDLRLKERGYNVHSFNQYVKKGRIYLMHGNIMSKYHAEKMGNIWGKNVRYGHTHDIQSFSIVSPIDHHERIAQSCGCLCKMNPTYMRSRSHKWQNALYTAHINPSGSFTEHLSKIVSGKFFRAEGKTYGELF